MQDSLYCGRQVGISGNPAAGIVIAGEAREIAAADLNANAVTPFEHDTGSAEVDPVFANLT